MLVIQEVCSTSYRDYFLIFSRKRRGGSRKGYVDTYFGVKDKGEGAKGQRGKGRHRY